MRGILLSLILLIFSTFYATGQELSKEVKTVYEACIALRTAAKAGSEPQMKAANKLLKKCRPGYFGTLSQIDRNKVSLNDHFIFDTVFVDSLIQNRKVYTFAQKFHNNRRGASTSSNIKVYTRDYCVRANGTAKFKFIAQERQELALVTEPDGMVNLKVYDCRNKMWHNDDDGLNTGKPYHVRVFDIPGNSAEILVEVINKTDKDVSFVIISN